MPSSSSWLLNTKIGDGAKSGFRSCSSLQVSFGLNLQMHPPKYFNPGQTWFWSKSPDPDYCLFFGLHCREVSGHMRPLSDGSRQQDAFPLSRTTGPCLMWSRGIRMSNVITGSSAPVVQASRPTQGPALLIETWQRCPSIEIPEQTLGAKHAAWGLLSFLKNVCAHIEREGNKHCCQE